MIVFGYFDIKQSPAHYGNQYKPVNGLFKHRNDNAATSDSYEHCTDNIQHMVSVEENPTCWR